MLYIYIYGDSQTQYWIIDIIGDGVAVIRAHYPHACALLQSIYAHIICRQLDKVYIQNVILHIYWEILRMRFNKEQYISRLSSGNRKL